MIIDMGKRNCRNILAWLSDVLRANPGSGMHAQLRLNCIVAWHRCDQLMDAAGMWFSAKQAALFQQLTTFAFQSNLFLLARAAFAARSARYQIKPKHHAVDEIGWDVIRYRRNPKSNWCFKHEDCIGRLARVAVLTHPLSMSKRVLTRWRIRLAMVRG